MIHSVTRLALIAFVAFQTATAATAQEAGGSTWAAAGGGALGLYSSAVLGVAGSLIPCNQTAAGVKCVRAAAAAGGVIGLVSGIYLGDADEDAVANAYRGAGYGALAGAGVGFALKEIVPHYGWLDVAAGAGIGAAVGSSFKGAVIGLAAGGALGLVLWQTIPSVELTDAVDIGLVGLAAGGLAGWVARAVDAQNDAGSVEPLALSLTVRF